MQIKDLYLKTTQKIPNYRIRPSQLKMVDDIDHCFQNVDSNEKNGQNIYLIEAPTGTGKSLAYLIAGVANAKRLERKLVISTATKTLQRQLVDKDIPSFIKYSGITFSFGLAKGRSNYLCPHQLGLNLQPANNLELFVNEDTENINKDLNNIFDIFTNKSWNGELDKSPVKINKKLIPLITIDKNSCIGNSCSFNQKNQSVCPYYVNREYLKTCDVIVTNHSLLIADITLGSGSVIPAKPSEYFLCIDEGHNFADIAINGFTHMFELKTAISYTQHLSKLIYNPINQSYIYKDIALCNGLYDKTEELNRLLYEFSFLLIENTHLFQENNRLILNDYLNVNLSDEFRDRFVNFAYISGELYNDLLSLTDKLKEQLKLRSNPLIELSISKLGLYSALIELIMQVSQYIINQDDSRYNANAKWIEAKVEKDNGINFIIYAGVTHVGNNLYNKLWSKSYATIITSATLAIGDDFSYYLYKLGLNLFSEVNTCKLPTSFIYNEQAQIVVPKFKASPEYNNIDNFNIELVQYLDQELDYDDSYGTLVLFFNRNQLQDTYNALSKVIQNRVLRQTEFVSSHELLLQHKTLIDEGIPSIIFGLNSFAEGVDLPAFYCMHVIITKLPFESYKSPQNMVQEYWIKYEKGSYFSQISLPEACIRLIQASGRLIRDESDYGQVSICDNRLVTKPYGSVLLDALPEFNRKYNPMFLSETFRKIEKS